MANLHREALAEQPAQQEPVLQDIEQYRLQMAGISTAAIGYWKEGDGIHPDYDTVALRDVAQLYAKYDALYKAQDVSHGMIAGALFDFMGWLTSRPKRIMLSSADDASPAVDAIKDFAKMRGLSLDDAQVQNWQKALAEQPAPRVVDCHATGVCVQSGLRAEQPAQYSDIVSDGGFDPRNKFDKPAQQEPVAWRWKHGDSCWQLEDVQPRSPTAQPLYTSPPAQRTWVGLTDEEKSDIWCVVTNRDFVTEDTHVYADAIETKLKEKNT